MYSFEESPAVGTFSHRLTDHIITGTKYYVRAFALVGGKPQYSNVVSFISQGSSTPVIIDFNPKQGSALDTITITGDHLGTPVESTTVRIGGISCQVLSTSLKEIKFRIPPKYITGSNPITLKAVDKTVTTATDFILEGPLIQSITPDMGPSGTEVTINGTGFGTIPADNLVYFADKQATVTAATATALQVIVPVITNAGLKSVSVEYNNAKTFSSVAFDLNGPTINSFSPASGPPGTQFTIYGEGFSSVPSENAVELWGGLTLQIISASQNELVVKIPEGVGANTIETGFEWSLHLTVRSISTVAADKFTVEGPSITGYSPSPQAEGREVTIYGKNLAGYGETDVYFGYTANYHDSRATIISSSPTEIRVKIPFGSSSQPALPENCAMIIKVGNWTHTSPEPFPVLRPWTRVAGFHNEARYGAVAFTIGSYSYYMTGVGIDGDKYDVWRYDVSNGSMIQLRDFPGQQRGFAFSFVIDGKACVGGGGRYAFHSPLNIVCMICGSLIRPRIHGHKRAAFQLHLLDDGLLQLL